MYEIDLNLPKQIVADVLSNHEIHSVAFVGCLMAGVSQGLAFSLAMLVMSRKTKNLSELFLISGFAQGTGYVIAGLGPWACGVLFDLVHELGQLEDGHSLDLFDHSSDFFASHGNFPPK
mgnify:CR=1 FL=1